MNFFKKKATQSDNNMGGAASTPGGYNNTPGGYGQPTNQPFQNQSNMGGYGSQPAQNQGTYNNGNLGTSPYGGVGASGYNGNSAGYNTGGGGYGSSYGGAGYGQQGYKTPVHDSRGLNAIPTAGGYGQAPPSPSGFGPPSPSGFGHALPSPGGNMVYGTPVQQQPAQQHQQQPAYGRVNSSFGAAGSFGASGYSPMALANTLQTGERLPVTVKLGDAVMTFEDGRWRQLGSMGGAGSADRAEIESLRMQLEQAKRDRDSTQQRLQETLQNMGGGNSALSQLEQQHQRNMQELQKGNLELQNEIERLKHKNKVLVAMCTVAELDMKEIANQAGSLPVGQGHSPHPALHTQHAGPDQFALNGPSPPWGPAQSSVGGRGFPSSPGGRGGFAQSRVGFL